MNVREAVAALNLSNNTILGLVEKGALGQVTRRGAEVWLKKSAVTAFGKKHAKVSDFESGLSLHPTMILRRLTGMNVEPVLAGYRGRHRMETVVRRRDVLKVFGLSDDPTRIADERFVGFSEFVLFAWLGSVVRHSIYRTCCPPKDSGSGKAALVFRCSSVLTWMPVNWTRLSFLAAGRANHFV